MALRFRKRRIPAQQDPFLFDGTETRIRVEGRGSGRFLVSDGRKTVAEVPVNGEGAFLIEAGVHPLFFEYRGEGPADILSFEIR